jgi:hypothetical protein
MDLSTSEGTIHSISHVAKLWLNNSISRSVGGLPTDAEGWEQESKNHLLCNNWVFFVIPSEGLR